MHAQEGAASEGGGPPAASHYRHAFLAGMRPRGTTSRMLGVAHTWTVKQTLREHAYANIVSMQQQVQLCTQVALSCVRVRPTAASCLAGDLQEDKAKGGAREISAVVVFWIRKKLCSLHL